MAGKGPTKRKEKSSKKRKGKSVPVYSPDEFGASGQLLVLKDMFSSFDREDSGMIRCQDLGVLIRLIGYNPTESQLQGWIEEFESKATSGTIAFHNFLTVMSRLVQSYVSTDEVEEEVIKAFREFDLHKCDSLTLSELRHVMTEQGEEPLTDVEWDEMAKHAAANRDGEVNYIDFVRRMRKK